MRAKIRDEIQSQEPQRRIRILITDDQAKAREELKTFIQNCPDLEFIGEAVDGDEALHLARKLQPDVIIMDLRMPRLNGVQATRCICSEFPTTKVIGFSMHRQRRWARAMRAAGAVAYLVKNSSKEQILATIRACVRPSPKPPGGDLVKREYLRRFLRFLPFRGGVRPEI